MITISKEKKKTLHIASCSFGKDSLATILLALEHGEPLDEAVYCEVMFDKRTSGEVPEHYIRKQTLANAERYITQELKELEARVRSLLRREFVSRDTALTTAGLTLDTRSRSISAGGEPLELTPREFAILEHLMLHQNRWVSQEELMEHVLESNANPFSNVVRMHISSLRKKLREALSGDPIQTKVGQGYRLMEDSEP